MHRKLPLYALAPLAAALSLALVAPAQAADPVCRDASGDVITPAPSTDQGVESGVDNATCSVGSVAVGTINTANNSGVAIGEYNRALGNFSASVGIGNRAYGVESVAIGGGNWAFGDASAAIGNYAITRGFGSLAFGGWFDRNGDGIMNLDLDLDGDGVMESSSEGTFADGRYAIAVGAGANATGDRTMALGANALASANFSVALGNGSVADRVMAVSVGNATNQRQIINVAAGTQATDAVNLGQMNAAIAAVAGGGSAADFTPVASAFGGGASYSGGTFTGPSYTLGGSSFGNVGDALTFLFQEIGSGGGGGTGGLDEAQVQAIADAGDATTLAAANSHADAGDAATLAASKSYSDGKATQTLASAKAYTDGKFAAWNDSFLQMQQQMDRRFAQTDKRIDRIGAMGTAMTQMAVNAALGGSSRGRIAIGVGGQGSQGAVSVGYGKRIGDRGSFSLGASFSGSESSAGAGFGFDL